jgi:hypothetical protein
VLLDLHVTALYYVNERLLELVVSTLMWYQVLALVIESPPKILVVLQYDISLASL